jgi:hypothetical protein
MAAVLPLKVKAAIYAVAGDAGLVGAVQSDTVARIKSQVRERSFIKGPNIAPHAWHAKKTPSFLQRVHVRERSGVRQNQWPYTRGMPVETSRSPQLPQERDQKYGEKIYDTYSLILGREVRDCSSITYAGIVAERMRMSVQALAGTRENGLRVMRSTIEDVSTVP